MLRATSSSAQHAIARLRSKSNAFSRSCVSSRSYASSGPRIRSGGTRTSNATSLRNALPSWCSINCQRFVVTPTANGLDILYRRLSTDTANSPSRLVRKQWTQMIDDYEKQTAQVFEAKKLANGQRIPRLRPRDFVTSQVTETDANGQKYKWWTTTFHCPVTGRIIQSGTLANLQSGDKKGVLHTSKYEEIDPTKVYISSLPYDATDEAVQKFISDNLGSLDDVKNIHIEPGRFKGYGVIQFMDAQQASDAIDKLHGKSCLRRDIRTTIGDRVDYKVFYKSRNIALEACVGRIIDSVNANNKQHTRVCTEEPEAFEMSKKQRIPNEFIDPLLDYYNRNGATIGRDAYEFDRITVSPQSGSHKSMWTASFTCPITGTRIDAGTVKPHLHSIILGDDNTEILAKDGKVLYQNKKTAHKACTVTVLDCLSEDAVNRALYAKDISLKQYCEEDPCVDLSAAVAEWKVKDEEDSFIDPTTSIEGTAKETSAKILTAQFQDPMTAIFSLHRMYNPKDLRSSSVIDSIAYKSSYLDDDESKRKRIYWSASFKSPITNEVFDSGILKNDDSVRIDGQTFYCSKKVAKMAALGHAVDCFVHRRGWVNNETDTDSFRLLVDDLDQYAPFCVDAPQDSAPGVNVILEGFIPPPQKENHSEAMMTPKSVIYSRYQKVLRDTVDKDCFRNDSIDVEIDGNIVPYFTSTFECPITGKIFPTGTLINVEKEMSPDALPPIKVIDGIMYYSDKKTADHACAGRTFDILSSTNFFSSFGGNDSKVLPQFCEESPHSYDEDYIDDDDDGDNYVIQEIPKAGNLDSGRNENRTTMDVVLDVWADHDAFQKQPKESMPTANAMSTALSWLEKMKSEAVGSTKKEPSTLGTLRQTTVSTFACNAILKALANMNATDKDDIEHLSRDIIKAMIELSNDGTEAASLPCAPDVMTFNSYIRCIQSPNPVNSANQAENLLDNMLNGKTFEGYDLPEPDCNTFNAVMKHWQSISSEDSHTKISSLFSRLELAMVSTNDLKPNKETFLIALRSLARQKDNDIHIFCPKKATKWIGLVEKYAALSDEDDMIVDTELFNAALPVLIPMDGLEDGTFMSEFSSRLDEGNPLRVNAVNVEEWFNSMQRMSVVEGKLFVAPNIKTYEAVIQSWVQNKSEEGLANAEKWAVRAIDAATMDSDVKLSLETFRSLMLAWAHSGSKLGPTKIQSLIDRLDELSEAFPELKPDGDLRSLLILSWRNHQLRCLEASQAPKNTTNMQQIGQRCTEYLSSMVNNDNAVDDLVLNGDVFKIVIDIWFDAARERPKPVLTMASEMMQVIKSYNHYIDSCNILNQVPDESSDEDESERQLWDEKCEKYGRIILDGDSIYEKLMLSIFSFAGESESGRKVVVEEHFHEIEKFLLRRERYRGGYCSKDGEFDAEKSFQFPESLFQETMRWCKYLSSPTRNGDAVRVVMSIFEYTLSQYSQEVITQSQAVDMYARAIDVIDTIVSNKIEKTLIVNRIVTNIMESDPGNESLASAMKGKVPDDVDVTTILARRGKPSRQKSKQRKRLRRRTSIK